MTFASAKFRSLLPAATFALVAAYGSALSGAVYCGNLLGESALAATNLMQGVMEIVNFVTVLLAAGTGVLFTKELGSFHLRRARGYFTLGMLSAVCAGFLVSMIAAVVRMPVLQAFAAAPDVTYHAGRYWLGYLPCMAVEPVSFLFCMLCYADGGSRLAIAACGAQLAVTWVAGYPLTRAFGAAGTALGLFCGQLALIAVLSLHFRSSRCMLGFSWHFVLSDLLRVIRISLGDASKNIGKSALLFALNAYVLAKFGADQLPVLAVVITTISFVDVIDCIGNALQPLVSVYVAERNSLLTRRVMGIACRLAAVVGVLGTAGLAIWPQLVLAVCGVQDPSVAAEAAVAVRLVSMVVLGLAFVYLFNSYYIYIGRERLSTVMALAAGFVLPAIFAPAFGAAFGLRGVWLGLGLAPFAALLLVAVYLVLHEGGVSVPFLLSTKRDAKLRVFDLVLTPERICETAAAVEAHLRKEGVDSGRVTRATLLVEETLMIVKDRNAGRRVLAEVTVDLNDDALMLILRDDGEIFDITDADVEVSSLRSYLVSNLMTSIPNRRNLTTTGFNRNVFRL